MAPRSDWVRHLEKEARLPVYVLLSSEPLLLTEAITALRQRVLTHAPDFNRDELGGARVTGAQIVAAANTLPMLATHRWVHVSEANKLATAEHAALIAYLAKPSASTVLCLSADKLDGRLKLGQALNRANVVFTLEPPRAAELPAWIGRRATQAGYTLHHDAATLLADLIGTELGTLLTSLDKLALYAGPQAAITTEHVEAVIAATRISSIFELTDALGKRDWLKASGLLRNILDGGESALVVLAMLVRQLRQLLKLKELQEGGARGPDIVQALGIRPFLLEPLGQAARRYTVDELYRAVAAAGHADERLKSGRLEHGMVLEQLLLEIMGKRAA